MASRHVKSVRKKDAEAQYGIERRVRRHRDADRHDTDRHAVDLMGFPEQVKINGGHKDPHNLRYELRVMMDTVFSFREDKGHLDCPVRWTDTAKIELDQISPQFEDFRPECEENATCVELRKLFNEATLLVECLRADLKKTWGFDVAKFM